MELHQLRYFVAAAEAGSITVAARRCHVAQPSLSAQIRKLEDSVGVHLFDRHGKGVALTEAGELLLPRARAVIEELAAVESGLKADTEAGRGALLVGAIPTVAPYLLPGAIGATRADFPDCSVRIVEDYTDRLIDMLIENKLDAAVMSDTQPNELIETSVIGHERFVVAVAASDPLARLDRVGLGDLRTLPMIILNEANCLGQQVAGYCAAKKIDSEIVCEAAQLVTVLELIRRGEGAALVPAMAAEAAHVEGVVFLPTAQKDAKREIVIARRAGRSRSVLASRFAEHAEAIFSSMPA